MKNITVKILPIIIIILVIITAAIYASTLKSGKDTTPQVIENNKPVLLNNEDNSSKVYDYPAGKRPDYGLPNNTFSELPPIPQDFWDIKNKFYNSQITDFVGMDEKYWKQPDFYPTFESNLDFMRNPQGSRIYAFGIGAYPGDIGAEAPADSQFTVATFFYASWNVETHQGVKLEVTYPNQADIMKQDLSGVNFTINQNPSVVSKYFNITFDPELFVLGPSAPVFDQNWAAKIKLNVTVNPGTPKGTYVIGVNPVAPPPEYSSVWSTMYKKYAEAAGFRVGRPTFQLVVFVI